MFDRCLYFNSMALGRKLERVWTRAFKPFDLTPSQAFMLRAVLNKPGMLQSELADTLQIARATATRAIDGLEKKDLLIRQTTKRDGRECEIHPTKEAIEMRSSLDEASATITNRLRAEFGDDIFSDFVEQTKSFSKGLA